MGRNKGTPIYYLEVLADGDTEPDVKSFNEVHWPDGERYPATVMVRGRARPATELGRDHGRDRAGPPLRDDQTGQTQPRTRCQLGINVGHTMASRL